jgi:hypothetical protein
MLRLLAGAIEQGLDVGPGGAEGDGYALRVLVDLYQALGNGPSNVGLEWHIYRDLPGHDQALPCPGSQ